MFKFKEEQKIYEIGKVKIGGQPGEYPTVLIGSIFYHGHKIVENPKHGVFRKNEAEKLIKNQEEISDLTGNPCFLDVFGLSAEALNKYVDFVAEVTDTPILLDGATANVRIESLKHVVEVGLKDKVIYNSISCEVTNEEIQAIHDYGLKASIVLVYDPKDLRLTLTPKGKLTILKGSEGRKGLLEQVKEVGIEKILIDVMSFAEVPSLGLSTKAIYMVKDELGYPTGCGPVNVIDAWKNAKIFEYVSPDFCKLSVTTFTQTIGSDFILYGPIENAQKIFPAVAVVDAAVAYLMRHEFGLKPLTSNHPLYKLF